MLKPSKHLNPDISVLQLAGVLLKKLRKDRIIDYSSLQNFLCSKINSQEHEVEVRFLFHPTLSMLYLLGVIDYHIKTDSFEYIERHENK